MSCSLCRLPFTPSTQSISPRWPPADVLSEKQLTYMKHAVGMGQHVIGLVVPMVYLDNNTFAVNNSLVLVNIIWETENKTFVAVHNHCALLLRHSLGLDDETPEAMYELALLDQIVGPTLDGAHSGQFKHVKYESVCGDDGKPVDIESLWSAGESPGCNNFDWNKWQQRGLDWTAVRPDVFPRFRPQVSPKRLTPLGPLPLSTTDVITSQPLDVLHVLLPYLPNKSFVTLLATCRTLRHHALTTFQSHARARVLDLGWAVPLQSEYDGFVKRHPPPVKTAEAGTTAKTTEVSSPTSPTESTEAPSPTKASGMEAQADEASTEKNAEAKLTEKEAKAATEPTDPAAEAAGPDLSQVTMAHAKHSPVDGDWLLYLSQIHRTQAMRARRWIWALAEEVARTHRTLKAAGPFADVVDPETGCVTKSAVWLRFVDDMSKQLALRGPMMGMIPGMPRVNRKGFSW